jgi:hypothetical protein
MFCQLDFIPKNFTKSKKALDSTGKIRVIPPFIPVKKNAN